MNPDLFYAARWDELYRFFAAGNPPLALQLLFINTVFLVIFVVRRMRNKTRLRSQSAYVVQAVLIAANTFLMFGPGMMSPAQNLWDKTNSVMPRASGSLDSLLGKISGK